MSNYMTEFNIYLQNVKQASSNTLEAYLRDVNAFLLYLQAMEVDSVVQVTEATIKNYMDELIRSGRSASTVTRIIASIRCYYQYLLSLGVVSANPAKGIKVTKTEKKLPEILTGKEINLLLSQPDVTEAKGCRDKAMLELLYATGIRVSELISLRLHNFNADVGIVHLISDKGERIVPMYPAAVHAVTDYLTRVRPILVLDPKEDILFANMNGQPLTRQGFWKIIKIYTKQANIKKDITPHTLRHSFATHLLENGAQLKDIKEMLGHSDISSTQVYAQIMKTHYAQTYKKFHPRAK